MQDKDNNIRTLSQIFLCYSVGKNLLSEAWHVLRCQSSIFVAHSSEITSNVLCNSNTGTACAVKCLKFWEFYFNYYDHHCGDVVVLIDRHRLAIYRSRV